ncbi:MAG TPA: malate dehydrogenase [Phycisphaerae bacterium]|nr:malate dehydrogenase [Phycisphaerae bacterium]
MKRAKITVIGAGNVGANCAVWAAQRELGDIVLIEIPEMEDRTKGRALDLAQCGPVDRFDARITGTSDYAAAADSDLVILTAGLPRKPGMSRDDLVETNVKIVGSCSEKIAKVSPNAMLIVVSNPLDAMVYTAWKKTGFPTHRVVGQAGCLDIARFRAFIAMELDCSVEDINALLMGGHGDDMVPLPRYTSVAGIPVTQLIPEKRLGEIVQRAKMGGGELVKLMGTSAYYAPSAGTIDMAESIIRDKRRIFPCAAYCDKEYGIGGYFVGVPCMLGTNGVEKVIEVQLDPAERDMLTSSANHVKELVELAEKFLKG